MGQMDVLPSEYIKKLFLAQKCKKSFCVWRVSKKLKKLGKIWKFFFYKINSQYQMNCANIWGPSDHSGRLVGISFP